MKLITPFTATVSSIGASVILVLLTNIHLYGVDFINAIAPVFILCISVFYSYSDYRYRIMISEMRYELLCPSCLKRSESLLKK